MPGKVPATSCEVLADRSGSEQLG